MWHLNAVWEKWNAALAKYIYAELFALRVARRPPWRLGGEAVEKIRGAEKLRLLEN